MPNTNFLQGILIELQAEMGHTDRRTEQVKCAMLPANGRTKKE